MRLKRNAFDINVSTSKFDGFQVDGGVYYKNDMYHYYGINLAEDSLNKEQLEVYAPRVIYNKLGGHLGLASTTTRVGELSHAAHIDYFYLFGREHNLDLGYTLGYTNNFWGDKSHPQKVGLDLGFQYDYCIGQGDNLFVVDRIWFKFNPFIETSEEFYRLHLGVRLDGNT